jgi:glycosyltransferase involved in cell wall biosynthesis
VLPSLSEGTPRSALEALHLGVPCVLRAADGNSELIASEQQGALFEEDAALPDTIARVAAYSRTRSVVRSTLLPRGFRQVEQARRYLSLVEGAEG